jgi:Uma2 family endonuclease
MSQTAHPPETRMTVTEFLTWYEKQTEGRYELIDGRIVAMAPERVRHSDGKVRAFDAIRSAVHAAQLPCRVFPDGMAVAIDDHNRREPDVIVQCGGQIDDDDVVLTSPIIVVEVLSPTTARIDTIAKLAEYFVVPSIRHYLIIDREKRFAIHHARDDGGKIETRIVRDGQIIFDPPGFSIESSELFSGG